MIISSDPEELPGAHRYVNAFEASGKSWNIRTQKRYVALFGKSIASWVGGGAARIGPTTA